MVARLLFSAGWKEENHLPHAMRWITVEKSRMRADAPIKQTKCEQTFSNGTLIIVSDKVVFINPHTAKSVSF